MKIQIDSLEAVPEALRSEYEEKDGKFFLKMEGDIPAVVEATKRLTESNSKVIEFRDTNIALLKEVEGLRPLKTQFEGIDPVKAKEAIAKVAALDKKGIKSEEDIDVRVKATVDELLKPLRDQLASSAAETAAERTRANELFMKNDIGEKFTKLGGKPKATEFVLGLAKDVFEVKDGAVVAKSGKFNPDKPGELHTPDSWLATIAKDYDFVIEPSKGGGAPAVKGTDGASVLKPGQTILKNPTPQQLGEHAKDIAAGKIKVVHEVVS
jgi:hypothetical protein